MQQLIRATRYDQHGHHTPLLVRVDRPNPHDPLNRREAIAVFRRLLRRGSFLIDFYPGCVWDWPAQSWLPAPVTLAQLTAQLPAHIYNQLPWATAPVHDLEPPITHCDQVCSDGVIRMLPDPRIEW